MISLNEKSSNPKKIRVLFFITSLAGGGAEKVVSLLLSALNPKVYDLHLLVNRYEGPYVDLIPSHVTITELKSERLRSSLKHIVKELKEIQPDVVISHLWEINVLTILAKKIGKLKFKTILCEHSTINRKRFFGANTIRKWAYSKSNIIVGVSEGLGIEIEQILKVAKKKIRVIYNPVIGNDFAARVKAPCTHPWFQEEIPVLIGLGRLVPEKRFDLFVEAIKELNNSMIPVRGIILGEGPLRKELENQRDLLNLNGTIDLLGFVENPLPYLNLGSVFIQTSDYEGLPTALIEAVACGIKIVATNTHTGTEEVLGNGLYGRIVSRGDLRGIVEQTKEILLENEWKKNKCLLIENSPFSLIKATNQYSQLIAEVMKADSA
ncbi:glycosyltransferase [Paenibacillus sp. N10]|uniref:Glycosyltransferase n=1 Tax=Paenibacillus lutrae TaxID=2078573 RepID=A0A7X3FFS0_9BACL|nr:glycosyltransferase [Paenibacillus lutrae]